jgi:hypothetical protein
MLSCRPTLIDPLKSTVTPWVILLLLLWHYLSFIVIIIDTSYYQKMNILDTLSKMHKIYMAIQSIPPLLKQGNPNDFL